MNDNEYIFNAYIIKEENCNILNFKFSRDELDDPYGLSNDKNNPLVIKNTIIKIISDILKENNIDIVC